MVSFVFPFVHSFLIHFVRIVQNLNQDLPPDGFMILRSNLFFLMRESLVVDAVVDDDVESL